MSIYIPFLLETKLPPKIRLKMNLMKISLVDVKNVHNVLSVPDEKNDAEILSKLLIYF